jgi:hypothetical protein
MLLTDIFFQALGANTTGQRWADGFGFRRIFEEV